LRLRILLDEVSGDSGIHYQLLNWAGGS
jgi:hypothetical protein